MPVLNQRLVRGAFAASFIFAQCPPSAAAPKPQIGNDPGLKCAMGLIRAQAMSPKTRAEALLPYPDFANDRLGLFAAETGNIAIKTYKTKADAVLNAFGANRAIVDAALAAEPTLELTRLKTDCVPMLEASEARRIPPTLGQCAAYMRHTAVGTMLQSTAAAPVPSADMTTAVVGALPGMLAAMSYSRMARQALVEQGKSPEQASQIVTDEAKAVGADVKRAGDKKLILAWDRRTCDQKFKAFRAAHPLPAAPSK